MLYKTLYLLLWPLFKILYRLRFVGQDNIPPRGPVILTANHASYLDPVCIALALKRPVSFMAKEELFKYPLFGRLLRRLNAFAVKRGRSDRQALRTALVKLERGEIIALFPQGTRIKSAEFNVGQKGAALLAVKSGAPVLPVAVKGTERILPVGRRRPRFPRVTVAVGRPFYIESGTGGDKRRRLDEATTRIMAEIEELWESN